MAAGPCAGDSTPIAATTSNRRHSDYESLSRLSQKHLQNANGLVALDGWSAIDQPVFHICYLRGDRAPRFK